MVFRMLPSIGTRKLIGIEGTSSSASFLATAMMSSSVSPIPMMMPEQVSRSASLAARRVFRRSW